MPGAVLLTALLAIFESVPVWAVWISIIGLTAGWGMKTLYWMRIFQEQPRYTVAEATGLGNLGTVRPLDPPHTMANFVMREMGYSVGRRHAAKLRWLVQLLGFALPMLLIALVALLGTGTLALVLMLAATAAVAFGVVVERWLFFAEAEHVVMLYYGREAA